MPPVGTIRNVVLSMALAALCVAGAMLVSRGTGSDSQPDTTPVARFSPAAVDATRPSGNACERDVCSGLGDPWSQASCAVGLQACLADATPSP